MHFLTAVAAFLPLASALSVPFEADASLANEVRNTAPRPYAVYCGTNGYQKKQPLQIIKHTCDTANCANICKKNYSCKSYSVSKAKNECRLYTAPAVPGHLTPDNRSPFEHFDKSCKFDTPKPKTTTTKSTTTKSTTTASSSTTAASTTAITAAITTASTTSASTTSASTTSSSTTTEITTTSSSTTTESTTAPPTTTTSSSTTTTSSSTTTTSAAPAGPTCAPFADSNNTYQTNGKTFEVLCDSGPVGTELSRSTEANLQACIDVCGLNSQCAAVYWQPSSRTCFLASVLTGTFTSPGNVIARLTT